MHKLEIKPDYYDDFQCTAKDCPITCCQEWKIAVDEDTYKNWQQLTIDRQYVSKPEETSVSEKPFDAGRQRLDAVELASCVCEWEGRRIMELNQFQQCPFLNSEKLCSLVLQFGSGILSDACTVFPRQVHEFIDRIEYSLTPCCPEIIAILSRQQKVCFTPNLNQIGINDILFQIRNFMIGLMQDETYPVSKALKMCFYLMLDMLERAGQKSGSKNQAAVSMAGYNHAALQELSDAVDGLSADLLDTFDERNELFLDLAENYRKEGLYTAYLEETAALAEQFAEAYDSGRMRFYIESFEKQLVRFEPLFRNYLAAELFADLLLPESNVENMAVSFQWIGMKYAAVKQAVFLNWLQSKTKELEYADIRNFIVILARMTGYDEADMAEYLENSFQSLIWEWGYFALIAG